MTKPKARNAVIQDGVTYRGKLATRITVTEAELYRQTLASALTAMGGPRPAAAAPLWDKIIRERMEKIPLLFKLYKVREGNWAALVYAMGCAHVPGFQLGKTKTRRPGRPHRDPDASAIRELIQLHRRYHPGATIISACKKLTEKGGPLSTMTASNARRQYSAGAAKVRGK